MDYEVMMNGTVRIGQMAPDFEAVTTFGNIQLSDYKGKWLVLFSHPGDFTPVCTTEMIAFSQACSYFKNINTELLGLSIDSNQSHLAWVFDIYCKTGVKIPFPIIADRSGEIARKYGMISNSVSNTETVRNVYIIDPNGVIRLILVYPLNVGRCIPEILRVLTALQTADETILEKGTGYITDIGMTGPKKSVIGMDVSASLKRFETTLPEKYKLADGNCMLNGCIFEINDESCRVEKITRVVRK